MTYLAKSLLRRIRPCFTAGIAALSIAVAGCGIKPSDVAPPAGAPERAFPATYPNPATDPQ